MMVNWCVSLRTSAHTGVAIPFDIAILSTMGIATSHGFTIAFPEAFLTYEILLSEMKKSLFP